MSKSKVPPQDRLLLFDIDHVLFDTQTYSDDVDKALVLYIGVNKELFYDADKAYYTTITSSTEYDPISYSNFIADWFKVAVTPIERITTDVERAKRGIYYDTYEMIDQFSREFEIGIYSEGNLDYQRMKLRSMNLALFLNSSHIYILPDKQDPRLIRSLPEGTIIADDKLGVIEFLSDFKNITSLLLDRDSKYPQYDGLYATSLEDMYKLLKKKRFFSRSS